MSAPVTRGTGGQTLHVLQELLVERIPAQLAVRDHVEPRALPHCDHLIDSAILDLLAGRGRQAAGLEPGPRAHQIVRAKQRQAPAGGPVPSGPLKMGRRGAGFLLVLATVAAFATGQASAQRRAVSARAQPTLLTGWYGRYTVRPTSIYYTGDGSGLIGEDRPHGGLSGPGRGFLRWTRWTRHGAAAAGTLWLKLGVPAFSRYTRFALTLTAGRVRDGHFTRMTLHFRQGGSPQTQTWCVPDNRRVSEWDNTMGSRCLD